MNRLIQVNDPIKSLIYVDFVRFLISKPEKKYGIMPWVLLGLFIKQSQQPLTHSLALKALFYDWKQPY